ncbi:hypothetical protein HanPSC8_Chr11g0491291 [Helianthus annuus]|nr:hypothetical protein HanPSC8_Chr11g0491291 [Helianthus annuus]
MFYPYITNVQDVKPDGNCGFRSIAAGLSHDESRWPYIRHELLDECNQNHDLYKNIDEQAYAEVRDSLDWNGITQAPMSKWLQMPYTGIMISNKWNIMLHLLSDRGCATFFPLFTKAEAHLPHQTVTIVHVNSNHFIMIRLEGDYPIPTPSGY